jgi:cation transport ATPase
MAAATLDDVNATLTETSDQLKNSDNRKVIVDAANAILIGASLIASVTYASWLILPYDSIVHGKAVKVYWAFNSLSFFFAVATVLGCASAAMPNFNPATFQRMLHTMLWRLRIASSFFIISVICVLGAFTSGAYVRVPHQQDTYFIDDSTIVGIIVGGTIISLFGMAYFTAAMVLLNH